MAPDDKIPALASDRPTRAASRRWLAPRLSKIAFLNRLLEHKLIDKPAFGVLEKPRVGRRDRVPTPTETEAILAQASSK